MHRRPIRTCIVAIGFFVALAVPLRLRAQEPQGYEDQVPGQQPAGWSWCWGEQGDDQFLVSNMNAATGRQAMLLDRVTGGNLAQWGLQVSLPKVEVGWLLLSFAFCMEGRGAVAHLGFELRNGPTRRLGGGFRYNSLSIHTQMGDAADGLPQGARLGAYRSGAWYRVRFWLPSAAAGQVGYAQLVALETDGTETPLSPPQPVACDVLQGERPLLVLNLPPTLRGFRFYLDDFTTAPVADPPRLPEPAPAAAP